MDASKTKKVTDFLATVGGGAAAGFVDTKFADKQIAGLAPGVIAGVALSGVGLMVKSKFAGPALAAGEGMLAYEAGRMTAERTTPSVTGVGFMRRLPQQRAFQLGMSRGRAISQAELASQLAALRAQGGKMGGIY